MWASYQVRPRRFFDLRFRGLWHRNDGNHNSPGLSSGGHHLKAQVYLQNLCRPYGTCFHFVELTQDLRPFGGSGQALG